MAHAKSSLGRSLIKERSKARKHTAGDGWLHTSELGDGYDWNKLNLTSVTEESSLDEFLRTAQLAGTEFTAEKQNISVVYDAEVYTGLPGLDESKEIKLIQDSSRQELCIPRRPHWDKSTTAEDLELKERDSFLKWRRHLAQLEQKDKIVLTPFEKNLEFWRQLWRVIERSDVIVQIVDARNPLLFRCQDLEKYVKEIDDNKINLILMSKSDLLTQEQREIWLKYFIEHSDVRKVVFWSSKIEELEHLEKDDDSDNDEDDVSDKDEDDGKHDVETVTNTTDTVCTKDNDTIECSTNVSNILSCDELLNVFEELGRSKSTTGPVTVGLVGYPNVGKSSAINTLLRVKKVPVSATPGRTKHFQTLYVNEDLILCDCPGLVFPNFVNTKADMICNGILPIDQMRDHVPSVSMICQKIPRNIFELTYGIKIPRPPEGDDPLRPPYAHELLSAYGLSRGFMTSHGQPDQSRSARYILKDFVNGKLLYCEPPPHIDPVQFNTQLISEERPIETDIAVAMVTDTPNFDKSFFEQGQGKVHTKGKAATATAAGIGPGKPWKKHNNYKKKEKTRRIIGDTMPYNYC